MEKLKAKSQIIIQYQKSITSVKSGYYLRKAKNRGEYTKRANSLTEKAPLRSSALSEF